MFEHTFFFKSFLSFFLNKRAFQTNERLSLSTNYERLFLSDPGLKDRHLRNPGKNAQTRSSLDGVSTGYDRGY